MLNAKSKFGEMVADEIADVSKGGIDGGEEAPIGNNPNREE